MHTLRICDDSDRISQGVDTVQMQWPSLVPKPNVGVIQDHGCSPRWTKYCRFLETNDIPYAFYDIDSAQWLESAQAFDVIVGIDSCQPYYLEQIRRKYYVIEQHLHKRCYPSYANIVLYEDKILEAYLSELHGFPFIKTYVFNSKCEAVQAAARFTYPIISKLVPCSGSIGVEMIKSEKQCLAVIKKAFSRSGRKMHVPYASQKNSVYFQDYVPNDGYDVRVIVIGDCVFGYYRKALEGDFRASGMGVVEKRELPLDAMQIARRVNHLLKSPMLVVDLLRGNDGSFHIIELSPICRIDTPEQLHVDGKPGVYIFSDDGTCRFERGRYWVHELALKEYFLDKYILGAQEGGKQE
ncbi:MAG: hypothetical protein HQ580_04205 [Planctomycetes bacterium]|nr:hypothetical protein [Planctomycetota bacterium]